MPIENQRLAELASQADVWARSDNSAMVFEVWQERYTQHLTKLIMQECMAQCDALSQQYLQHRKGTTDFDEKNIYAEGEAACDTLKYKLRRMFV